jgi:hypothetical protein
MSSTAKSGAPFATLMMHSSLLSFCVCLGIVVLSSPRSALAGSSSSSIEMSKTAPVVRVDDDTVRPSAILDKTGALTLNRTDCRSERLKYRYSLTVTGYDVTQSLQAWVARASDCAEEFTRATSVTRTCWRAVAGMRVADGTATVDITPKQLLGIDVDDLAGNQRILRQSCDDEAVGKGLQPFSVQFLLIDNGGHVIASTTQLMFFSLVGVDAPAITNLSSSNDALKVEWEKPVETSFKVNYEFYCGINVEPNDCSSPQLEQFGSLSATNSADIGDTLLPENLAGISKHLCGSVAGREVTAGMTNRLQSGTSHAVALGVRDPFGNLGALSKYQCAIPEPLTAAEIEPLTGRACSIALERRDGMTPWWLPLAVLCTISSLRRRVHAK